MWQTGLWRATIAKDVMEDRCPTNWAFGVDLQSFSYYTQQLVDMWPQKLLLGGLLSAACQFFFIDHIVLWTWVAAIVGDFIAGVCVGYKHDQSLDLLKLRKGLVKIIHYAVFIVIVAAGGMVLNRGFGLSVPWINGFLAMMTITELKSISRNLEILGFRVPVEMKMLLKIMHKKPREEFKKHVEVLDDESDDPEDGNVK